MKTTKQKNEASAPANVRPSESKNGKAGTKKQNEFVRHCANRQLSTEVVLNYLRTKLPQQYGLAEVVGKWVWLDVSPARKPGLASVLCAFIGISGAAFGSILAASLTRSASIPPTPAPKVGTFGNHHCSKPHWHCQ